MQSSTLHLKNKFLTLLLPLIMAVVVCAGSVPDVFASIAGAPAPIKKEALLGAQNRIAVYQGQYWDEEIELCYNRFRYFDPQICAFISQDPIGLAGGENVYAYSPNVWAWVDPLGLKCKQYPEFENFGEFSKFFGSIGNNKYRKHLYHNVYKKDQAAFFSRNNVQDTLKAKGYLDYTLKEKFLGVNGRTGEVVGYLNSDAKPAQVVQGATELARNALVDEFTEPLFNTKAGAIGGYIGSAIKPAVQLFKFLGGLF